MFTFGRNDERTSSVISDSSDNISSTKRSIFSFRKGTDSSNSSTSDHHDFGSDSGESNYRESGYYLNKKKCDGLVKLLMIGDAAVGKSALVNRYVDDVFHNNWIGTIGIDIRLKQVQLDGKQIKVQLWDTAGQERFRAITTRHFHGVHGVCIVFDVTDRSTFSKIRSWIRMANDSLESDIPRVVLGNKIDLEGKRAVSFEEASEFCDRYGLEYVEVSAQSGENVQNVYFNLISKAFQEQRKHEKDKPTTVGRIKLKDKRPTRRCC